VIAGFLGLLVLMAESVGDDASDEAGVGLIERRKRVSELTI
jgi:hypothetical protein